MADKQVRVVAAIVVKDGAVLATERGYGEYEGWWEFPGGKIEEGESPEAALTREIHEELNAAIEVGDCLCTAEYDYPTFHLSMQCFLCTLVDEDFELIEHHAARWLDAANLNAVKWLPADLQVLAAIRNAGVL